MNFAVFISGIAVVMSQTLLIREGLAFFSGNELVSGFVLCLWLLWTGLGSHIYSKIKLKIEPKRIYAILIFLLCLALIFSLIFFRIAPKIFILPFGEVISIDKIILISLIALAPTCLITGALFPSASAIITAQKVYLIEGLGAFAGGIIFSFILIYLLPPFGVLLVVFTLLLFAGFLCLNKRILSILCFVPLIALFRINNVEFFFRKIQMQGQNLIGLYESKYGTVALTKSESQTNFYTSGFFDFAYPDLYSAEEAVHYPLLLHKQPEDVLLVGGGMGGSIEQILKYTTIKKLIYLELNPKLIEVSTKYLNTSITDKRLNIIVSDGRFYIKNTKERFDCIIVNLPDPINVQLNRYYTKEFFQEVKKILKPYGLFSIRATSPPDILSPLYSQFLGAINKTLKQVFKNVYILPVAKATYIAMDWTIQEKIRNILEQRIIQRGLNLLYVNSYFFDYNLSDEKIEYLNRKIEKANSYINTDLKPICYYFNSVLWGSITSINLKNLFIKLFNLNPIIFFLPLALAFLFWRRRTIIQLSVFSIGATEISAEIILLILFQVLYGYIYAWLGIIIGLFMLGLACGTFIYIRFKKKPSENYPSPLKGEGMGDGVRTLSLIQLSIALYFLIILFMSIAKIPGVNYIIGVLIFVGGFFGGLHFPLSVEILGSKKAGVLYGIDLLGSSFGAIITTIIFIPILGIIYTLLIFVLLNIIVGAGLRVKIS